VTAPAFVKDLLGWRAKVSPSGTRNPNTSDSHSATSVAIAAHILTSLGIPETAIRKDDPGSALEEAVKTYLAEELESENSDDRQWEFDRNKRVIDFAQYEHLARIQQIIRDDETKTLGVEIGRDYVIKPDVTVGIRRGDELMLHAAVSCKWTIRSDRVQNVRHEAVILTRHRRGRQPHIVGVTVEPLPSRLASIARGTGEIDAVYHVAFDELVAATSEVGTKGEKEVLSELVDQKRLLDFTRLPDVLRF
jgi:hypothetical protein